MNNGKDFWRVKNFQANAAKRSKFNMLFESIMNGLDAYPSVKENSSSLNNSPDASLILEDICGDHYVTSKTTGKTFLLEDLLDWDRDHLIEEGIISSVIEYIREIPSKIKNGLLAILGKSIDAIKSFCTAIINSRIVKWLINKLHLGEKLDSLPFNDCIDMPSDMNKDNANDNDNDNNSEIKQRIATINVEKFGNEIKALVDSTIGRDCSSIKLDEVENENSVNSFDDIDNPDLQLNESNINDSIMSDLIVEDENSGGIINWLKKHIGLFAKIVIFIIVAYLGVHFIAAIIQMCTFFYYMPGGFIGFVALAGLGVGTIGGTLYITMSDSSKRFIKQQCLLLSLVILSCLNFLFCGKSITIKNKMDDVISKYKDITANVENNKLNA